MLATPQTLSFPFESGAVEVLLSRVNQDNNGSTFFAREDDGTEHQIKIKHTVEGKPSTGQRERHVVDYTKTSYDDLGQPTTVQTYIHMIVPRGKSMDGVMESIEAILRFGIHRGPVLLDRAV